MAGSMGGGVRKVSTKKSKGNAFGGGRSSTKKKNILEDIGNSASKAFTNGVAMGGKAINDAVNKVISNAKNTSKKTSKKTSAYEEAKKMIREENSKTSTGRILEKSLDWAHGGEQARKTNEKLASIAKKSRQYAKANLEFVSKVAKNARENAERGYKITKALKKAVKKAKKSKEFKHSKEQSAR